GKGTVDFTFNTTTDTFAVTNSSGTDTTTTLAIHDLTGTDLAGSSVAVSTDIGTLTSDVDITSMTWSGAIQIHTVTIDGGVGTIGTLTTTGDVDAATTINGNVGTFDTGTHNFTGALTVNGGVSSITTHDINAA